MPGKPLPFAFLFFPLPTNPNADRSRWFPHLKVFPGSFTSAPDCGSGCVCRDCRSYRGWGFCACRSSGCPCDPGRRGPVVSGSVISTNRMPTLIGTCGCRWVPANGSETRSVGGSCRSGGHSGLSHLRRVTSSLGCLAGRHPRVPEQAGRSPGGRGGRDGPVGERARLCAWEGRSTRGLCRRRAAPRACG